MGKVNQNRKHNIVLLIITTTYFQSQIIQSSTAVTDTVINNSM